MEVEFKNLEEFDIIERVEGLIFWVFLIVVVLKKIGICICVDMRVVN